ncbi:hypothetical protein M422DRAFT_28986 [Sphaerobolus stellatus SS14]|uniref:Uncharacterized protein n=1 Tax=Sphaerobolus stellatus (strain SS14) TaxID=990650 RepID=A0A0C9W451_SPHS4|nr:hypothetical protein M422DRAFT_28986 [Sphaerobolus stellatus SS14]
MAAPAEMNTADISATFIMFKRKAISIVTITLHVNHYKDDAGVEHIDTKQTLTGSIEGNVENRTIDGVQCEYKDGLFGDVISKTRRVKVDELEYELLKTGWISETIEPGVIHSYVVSDEAKSGRQWTAEQAWGFETINGQKRYVRHLQFTSGSTLIEAKLIYDYGDPYQK